MNLIPYAAIDLGYFQTKYMFCRAKGDQPQAGLLPSVAPIVSEQRLARGSDMNSVEVNNGFYIGVDRETRYVGTDARSKDTSTAARTVDLDWCLSGEYRALYLGTLAHISRQVGATDELSIEVLTVGLPVTNHQSHKDRLIKMSKGTHVVPSGTGKRLNVTVEEVSCLMQPTGALAKATGLQQSDALIIDMGGGTVDWYGIIDGKGAANRRGSARLGMSTCAKRGLRLLAHDLYQDPLYVARFAEALCGTGDFTFSVGGEPVAPADLEAAYKAAWQTGVEALDTVQEGSTDFARYGHVVFTGGGGLFMSRIFLQRYPHLAKRVVVDDDPVYSIVQGFLSWAAHMHAVRTRTTA